MFDFQTFLDQGLDYIESHRDEASTDYDDSDRMAALIGTTGAFCKQILEGTQGKASTLIIDHRSALRCVTDTIPIRDFGEGNNVVVVENIAPDKKSADLVLKASRGIRRKLVSLGATFRRTRNHHFNLSDGLGRHLPVSIITDPFTECAERCAGCSRMGCATFTPPPESYVNRSVQLVDDDFSAKFPDLTKSALKNVTVITGCQPTAQAELTMFLNIVEAYRKYGFSDTGFTFFSNRLSTFHEMLSLVKAGATAYVSTMECFDDDIREKAWGKIKGEKTLEYHRRATEEARNAGMSIVEVALVLGHDDFSGLMRGIDSMESSGVHLTGAKPRFYLPGQPKLLHPDFFRMGFEYLDQSLRRLSQQKTIGTAHLFRELSLEFLISSGWEGIPSDRDAIDRQTPHKYR